MIDHKKIAINYLKYKLSLKDIEILETPKSSKFDLLTEGLKKIIIITAIMSEHKTIKNNKGYIYNFWEFQVPKNTDYDLLICFCFENIEHELKINGWFSFPYQKIEKSDSISIFESDISGNYIKEPKFFKHEFFNNTELFKN